MAEPGRSPLREAEAQTGTVGARDTSSVEIGTESSENVHVKGEDDPKDRSESNAQEQSDESISEHIMSNMEYSVSSHDVSVPQSRRTPDLLQVVRSETTSSFRDSPLPPASEENPIPTHGNNNENSARNSESLKDSEDIDKNSEDISTSNPKDIKSENNPQIDDLSSRQSHSWPIPVTDLDDAHISSESPVNLPMESSSHSNRHTSESIKEVVPDLGHTQDDTVLGVSPREPSVNDSAESERFLDSLSEKSRHSDNIHGSPAQSSSSEEIIKLDIRGKAAPRIPLITEKIIFGPPPEGGEPFDDSLENVPAMSKLFSHFILGTSADMIKVKDVIEESTCPGAALGESFYDSLTDNQKLEQRDLLVEELTIHDSKEKDNAKAHEEEHVSFQTQTKSLLPDIETTSFSTLTTDYKTICEEYHVKLVHLEEIVARSDEKIHQLDVSLQRTIEEKKQLELQNEHLTNEVQNLQHYVGELSSSDHNTAKGQLSDFMKYENLLKDDSTKFFSAIMSNAPSESVSRSSNGEKDMDREELTINFSKSDPKSSEESDGSNQEFDDKLTEILSTLDEFLVENIRNEFKERLAQLFSVEVNRIRVDCETEVKEIERQLVTDKQSFGLEIRRMNELLSSVQAGSADLDQLREQLNSKHEKEMENLRTYFEKKCSDMEKNYSEDVELSARAASSGGSASSLEAACEAALPYSSPLRAAGDYRRTRERLDTRKCRCPQQLDSLRAEHAAHVSELRAAHRDALSALEERVTQLRAHVQTAENTERPAALDQDIDLELEKGRPEDAESVRQDVIMRLQEQIQVLLADPSAELSSWPLDLVALRERLHGDAHHTIQQMKISHREELSQLRAELGGGEAEGGADTWRRRRNHSFDQNRQLEEVTKERDGLKRVACTLQKVVTQLVAYCAAAEDELNRTVLAELLTHVIGQADGTFDVDSKPCSPNLSPHQLDLNSSLVRGKHVHFAPDFRRVLADMDEDSLLGYLQSQDDLSAEIKNELDLSLQRLRTEAQELLDLSGRYAGRPSVQGRISNARRELEMTKEENPREIQHLMEQNKPQPQDCDNCQLREKHMEDIQAESVEREGLLRSELQAAMMKIALMTDDEPPADVIAEGYGTAPPRAPLSLPAPPRAAPSADSRSASLDGASPGRARSPQLARLAHELDALARERDDLVMQLEAANRQLRATRQFVEEQTAEREAEREEAAAQLGELRDENARLAQRLLHNARILGEVEQLEVQTREMNVHIKELEDRKSETDSELKATIEKISLLRDIIANLESQLEQKSSHESDILERLEEMRKTIDERDGRMRSLLGELESLKSERAEQTDVSCARCSHSQDDEDAYSKLLNQIKDQARWLEDSLHRRTQRLERLHEAVCSASCSEPSEDVSIRDQKQPPQQEPPTREREDTAAGRLPELAGVWERLEALGRAEEAAVKRVRDLEMQRARLKDAAQEVRAERDVLQQRMSEQALKISPLAARLEQQRTHAEALCHESTSRLSVQLHDALDLCRPQEVRAERDVLQQRMSEQALKISSLAARLEQQRTHAEALCHESTSRLSVQLHDALDLCRPQEVRAERDVLQQRMSEQALKISPLAARLEQQRTHAEALCHESTSRLSVQLHDALDLCRPQEVRAERDVLQQRMSEQALKISSLAARLEQQRTHAEALCHESTSRLSVQLHDALAEVQRLTEEMNAKDKQLTRLKQGADEGKRSPELHDSLHNSSCQPKDKIIILERELASAQSRVTQLEALARTLENDKAALIQRQKEYQRQLAERDVQLQEILALKLDDENEKDHKNEVIEGAKNSARTLSDIVSISDYDEQDLQIRRAEQKHQNISGVPYPHDNRSMNRTLPPDLNEKHQLSSLHIEPSIDHLDLAHFSPNSLPIYLTSTANKDKNLMDFYKRNVNETTVFGNLGGGDSVKRPTSQMLHDNCSMFPNREVSDSKNLSIDPKKIDFSMEPSDPVNRDDNRVKTLEELGISIDVNQERFPDILTQLKHEITILRAELDRCRTELKQAEEQLCEFPALKEEVEELKTMLEGTVDTMEQDKKFYENQLENFTTTKHILEQQLTDMSEQVNEKSNDLHLLKEDILRRENMVLELAKEKRNLVNKMTELQLKYDTLERKNEILENHERENNELKQKLSEFRKMEQLVSEKNLQIDNLNEHLNRLDDMQRCLDDKTEEADRLKESLEQKINELEQLRDTNQAMSRDLNTVSTENSHIVVEIRNLREKLSKMDQDKESTSFQLQTSISELEKMSACNIEMSAKLEDMKALNDKLEDKECEIEILKEDINYFHEQIASLTEELKIVSRSPSPRDNKGPEEKGKAANRRINADKKELARIRKNVSLLQHELAFNKKDLNEKAFELARAKLDLTELKNNLNQAGKLASDREIALSGLAQENTSLRQQLQQLAVERNQLGQQLNAVDGRLREESDFRELEEKLMAKTEQCLELEQEMEALKRTIEQMRESPGRTLAILPAGEDQAVVRSGRRSPTAELENAVRAQLSYSHRLDDSIMEQILSGASHDGSEEEVPRLQLDVSKSSSSLHSSSSERLTRLRSENEALRLQVSNIEARLTDKEALINELNRIRDKLVQDWQTAKLQFETEKDNSGRLQLLLDTQKETADSLQNQDLNMIATLKKRLERSMEAELDLQQSLQKERLKSGRLERQLGELGGESDHQRESALKLQRDNQAEATERARGEAALLRSRLERERTRLVDLQNMLDQSKLQFQREVEARTQQCTALRQELAELKRLKHDLGVELVRARETIHVQKSTIKELERKLSSDVQRPFHNALSEFEEHKAELSREISALKRSLDIANTRETQHQYLHAAPLSSDALLQIKEEKAVLQDRIRSLEHDITSLRNRANGSTEDKDQAVRFLHSRCLRLESCRKALVWQKRYLQRVLAGYAELERYLQRHSGAPPDPPARRSFKSVAVAVVGVVRMAFLVRRRQSVRTLSADVLLRRTRDAADTTLPRPAAYTSNSPPSRDRPAPRANLTQYYTPPGRHPLADKESLTQPRNLRRPDLRIDLEPSAIDDRSAPLEQLRAWSSPAPPCDDDSVTSSGREQLAAAALLARRLDSMSRRLQEVRSPRDVP